ncbi:MAG: hypothetical protein ACI8UR_000618 [Natronomonas sp.]|jgi:hypothetical protein|uniref:hypothetical protein n=1 Tax=Natronomonas sp. TaxID=2184060 RepID=UPI003989C7D9
MTDTPLDAETLLGEAHEPFEAALSDPTAGPLAVVGDPYGGRETVLDRAETRLDATRVRLDQNTGADAVEAALGDGPLVVDDCHQLYTRSVGGFEPLSSVLDALATADVPVVTGWNSYAWSYLDAVRDIETAFSTRTDVEGLSATQLLEFIRSKEASLPEFRRDELDEALLMTQEISLGSTGRTVSVPMPNREAIEARRADRPDPSDAVFERLADLSNGDPGTALALWKRHHDAEILRPSALEVPTTDETFDREAAFCLRIILATERVARSTLSDRIGDRFDRLLGRFTRAGFVTVSNGVVQLDPAAVPTVAKITERGRIL